MNENTNKQTQLTLKKCLIVVVLMGGFGYALVPLYDVICDITGLNGKTGIATEQTLATQVVDENHTVTVQFDGTVNSRLPWSFKPVKFSMEVVPGKMYTAEYIAQNIADYDVTGQAVPSVAPNEASMYFDKTECFCFTQQLLKPGESKNMPVTFIVRSDIPKDIDVLTLSYTFFNRSHMTAEQKSEGSGVHEQI